MDNVKMEFKIPEKVKINHEGFEFYIVPFLSYGQQLALINTFIENYFFPGVESEFYITRSYYNYPLAEVNMRSNLLRMTSNIDMDNFPLDFHADSIFWKKVTQSILNYSEFNRRLETIVNEIKEQRQIENSLGNVVDNAVQKLYGILEKFSSFTPEDVENTKKAALEVIKKLEETSVLGNK